MWNHRGALLAYLMASAGTATAMPDCKGDWEYQAMLIEGHVSSEHVFAAAISGDLSARFRREKGGLSIEIKTTGDASIPIRAVRQGVAPVRGNNPLIKHHVFGPDVLDPALHPELTVPGGNLNAAMVEPTPGLRGQVWVLADARAHQGKTPEPAGAFKACVRWTHWPRTPKTAHYPSPELLVNFPSWVVMAFVGCGLPETLLLSGRMLRPGYRNRAWLEPDLNGDGLYDLVALVDEPNTGRSGLAVCSQADRTLEVLGLDVETSPENLSSDFLAGIDWWSIDGRSVILGIEGAGSQRLYRERDGHLTSDWMGD